MMLHLIVIGFNFTLGYFLEGRKKLLLPLLGILTLIVLVSAQIGAEQTGTSVSDQLLSGLQFWHILEAVVAWQLGAALWRHRNE